MISVVRCIAVALEIVVAAIAFVMARKCLGAKRWLAFHQKGASTTWESLSDPMQLVTLTLLRQTGCAFLSCGVLLSCGALAVVCGADDFATLIPPAAGFVFCLGLFWANVILYRKTEAPTPWQRSLVAAALLAAAIGLLALGR
jgi:hypothetical protein